MLRIVVRAALLLVGDLGHLLPRGPQDTPFVYYPITPTWPTFQPHYSESARIKVDTMSYNFAYRI